MGTLIYKDLKEKLWAMLGHAVWHHTNERTTTKYLNAHPYGERQSQQREQDGEKHQDPTTQANVTVSILQGCKAK